MLENQSLNERQKEKGSTQLDSYQQERLATFKKFNSKIEADSLVFVGDSITEFFPLKKYLGYDLPLVNRGIAGTDSLWLLQHLQEQVLVLNPAKVFLMIGINDIGRGYQISDILARIKEIVANIKANHNSTKIYLLSILPVNESDKYAEKVKIRNNRTIQQLNHDLQSLSGVEYLNLYPVLVDARGNLAKNYTIDGLHLSQTAYAKLAEQLKKVL